MFNALVNKNNVKQGYQNVICTMGPGFQGDRHESKKIILLKCAFCAPSDIAIEKIIAGNDNTPMLV